MNSVIPAPFNPQSTHLLEPSLAAVIAFVLLAALVLGGAILTITRRNLVSSVMALVATFFGVAGLYVMLSAHFLAAIQILVYAGGIMVLFVFVVMVLNREETKVASSKGIFGKVIGSSAIAYVSLRLSIFLYAHGQMIETSPYSPKLFQKALEVYPPTLEFGTVRKMGEILFTDFLFPFEAISILLLIAVIAAVILARSFASQATSLYDLPSGEKNMKQPAHTVEDEMVGVLSPELIDRTNYEANLSLGHSSHE